MKTGDYVAGRPTSERFQREVVGRVIGTLEITDVTFGTAAWKLYQVHVKYSDGSPVPIDVIEASISHVDRTTVPTTVIPLP